MAHGQRSRPDLRRESPSRARLSPSGDRGLMEGPHGVVSWRLVPTPAGQPGRFVLRPCLIVATGLLAMAGQAAGQPRPAADWPRVGNDPGCLRYSGLDQINRGNVTRLKPAWTYHTGELRG